MIPTIEYKLDDWMINMQSASGSSIDVDILAKRINAMWIIDWILAFVLAICPILQHYKGLFMDASSMLVVLISPLIILKIVSKKRIWVIPLIPLALYSFYLSLIHGLDLFTLGREALLLVFFIAALNEGIDTQRMLRISVKIAVLACVCEIVQYLSYYIFGMHIQMVPTGMLLDTAEQWIQLAQTGRISVTGSIMKIYRPSAFFLEPSHLAIYCTPALAITLLSGKNNKRKMISAIIITLGILLSTSGLGIGVVTLLWSVYGLFYFDKNIEHKKIKLRDIFQPRSIIFVSIFFIIFVVLYSTVGVFRSSVNHIFIGTDGKSAIQGRTTTGIRSLQMLSGRNLLIGMGDAMSIADWTMPGFFYNMFKYGLVGCLLSYIFYFKSLFILRRGHFWLTVIVIIFSFFTVHTFAAFYRMYYIIMILHGYKMYSPKKG